jgi:hypothetical protein
MFKLFLILITVPRDQKSMTVPYPWVETEFAFKFKHKYQVGLRSRMIVGFLVRNPLQDGRVSRCNSKDYGPLDFVTAHQQSHIHSGTSEFMTQVLRLLF